MIKFLDLQKITQKYSAEIHEAVAGVIDSGWYLTGIENQKFEAVYAGFIGTRLKARIRAARSSRSAKLPVAMALRCRIEK